MYKIDRIIEINLPVGACNLCCPYCYIAQHQGKMQDFPYPMHVIRKAFSRKRLGGTCLISICSDGETMLPPQIVGMVKELLEEGHFITIVTNGMVRKRIEECLTFPKELLERLFFKVSFHFEELKRRNLIQEFFDNIRLIKESPCSYTVEAVAGDEALEYADEMKEISMQYMGVLPQLTIPRDERKYNLGVASRYSLDNFIKKWEQKDFHSELFKLRKEYFGKKNKGFCYAGDKYLYVRLNNGYSYQCYHSPALQDFMGEYEKPVKWLPIGHHCPEAHCYAIHLFLPFGIVQNEKEALYISYREIRDRRNEDGEHWLKPTFAKLFTQRIEQKKYSRHAQKMIDYKNLLLKWKTRKERG